MGKSRSSLPTMGEDPTVEIFDAERTDIDSNNRIENATGTEFTNKPNDDLVNGKTIEQIEEQTYKKLDEAYDRVLPTYYDKESVEEVRNELEEEVSYNYTPEELDGMSIDDWVNEFEFILAGR